MSLRCAFCALFLTLSCVAVEGALQVPQSSLLEVKNQTTSADEIIAMDSLIESTARQLESQKHLREMMIEFIKQKEEFMQGNQTKSHASFMVRTARQIYEQISSNHIQNLFPQDYLDELVFFSSIAGKNTVKQP